MQSISRQFAVQQRQQHRWLVSGRALTMSCALLMLLPMTELHADHSGIVISTDEIKMVGKRQPQEQRPFEFPQGQDRQAIIVTEPLRFVGKRGEKR